MPKSIKASLWIAILKSYSLARQNEQLRESSGVFMNITEVKVFPVNEDRLKAYISITIDNCFVVRDLKIILNPEGELFVAMPSKKRKDGQFRDIAHPLNQETRTMIEDAVFKAYETELSAMGQSLDQFKRAQSR